MSRIPGPSDGSYMITSEHADPEVRYLRIYDRSWAEMGGLWDVHGDFMGGPFLNFSTLDAATNRVIAIDCFVFAPQDTKRNYLRQLEHIVYSAQFPEVATPTVETGTENQ